jgi:mRNA interferase MazF
MNCRRGDIVLADYPHALTGSSLRPALIIQADTYNGRLTNTVVAQITRTLKRSHDPAHLHIDVSTPEGKATGLLHNSVVSCINLNTLHVRRIRRVLGRRPDTLMPRVDDCLRAALGI